MRRMKGAEEMSTLAQFVVWSFWTLIATFLARRPSTSLSYP
jgi:hypothetical protein